MRQEIFLPTTIIAGAVLIMLGAFGVSGRRTLETASTPASPPQWTQAAGSGIIVPACGSSSASVSCSGGTARVDFSWSVAGPAPNGASCVTAAIRVNGSTIASGLSCSGSYTWGGAAPNTTYSYEIVME